MALLEDLRTGRCGVRLSFPARVEVRRDEVAACLLFDRERELGWHVSLSDVRLDLRPRHHALLVRDAERHARDLFELTGATLPRRPGEQLRTADANWSPLVELAPAEIGGAPALRVIHRMSYQPGHEMLMGHLLVPVRAGLLDVRAIARAQLTGLRESMLFAAASKSSPGEGHVALIRRLNQAYYDDPAHDATFRDHPLSRVRAGLSWLLAESGLQVTAPAPAADEGEVVLPPVGHALVPPPRYLLTGRGLGEPFAQFTRVSFAASDGLQLLSVSRTVRALPGADAEVLRRFAQEFTEASAPPDATEVRATTEVDAPDRGRSYLEYDDPSGRRHTAFRWRCDAAGDVLMLALAAPRSAPREEIEGDLEAVVTSLRPLGA